jgi:hypothetical protein
MVKIGSDIDGVLAYHGVNKDEYKPFRLHEYYSKAKPTKLSKMPIDVIITGRKIYFKKLTQRWLELHGVNYKELIMFPNKTKKTNQSLAEYKSRVINELGITKYYEDDVSIANYLKQNCLGTKIIFVEDKVKL